MFGYRRSASSSSAYGSRAKRSTVWRAASSGCPCGRRPAAADRACSPPRRATSRARAGSRAVGGSDAEVAVDAVVDLGLGGVVEAEERAQQLGLLVQHVAQRACDRTRRGSRRPTSSTHRSTSAARDPVRRSGASACRAEGLGRRPATGDRSPVRRCSPPRPGRASPRRKTARLARNRPAPLGGSSPTPVGPPPRPPEDRPGRRAASGGGGRPRRARRSGRCAARRRSASSRRPDDRTAGGRRGPRSRRPPASPWAARGGRARR